MATREQAQALVRAVWPNSQREFERLCDEGHHPNNAAFYALDDVDGLTWSFSEALDAAGLEREDW